MVLNTVELQEYLDRYVTPALQRRCGALFQIRIQEPANAYHDHGSSDPECTVTLYKDGRIISTLKMEFYFTHPKRFDVLLESETVVEQRRKKYNTLLRMVGLLLATKMKWGKQKVGTIESMAVSWISVYVLHRMGFKAKSILTSNGLLEKKDMREYRSRFHDRHFLASKLSQSKVASTAKDWKLVKMQYRLQDRKLVKMQYRLQDRKLVKMQYRLQDRKRLRRQIYHEMETDVLPFVGCGHVVSSALSSSQTKEAM